VRTAYRRCGDELRVPFPCKGRGFCPSCMGRRMAEGPALREEPFASRSSGHERMSGLSEG
jgi:hypothetical protein